MSALSTAAMVAAGIAALLAVVVLALRFSRRSTERLRATVSRYESVLAAVSEKLGLKLERPAAYEHPIVGSIPAWPSATGAVEGVAVTVEVDSEYGGESPIAVRTRLRLRPPAGTRLRSAGVTIKLPRHREKLAAVEPQLVEAVAALAERLEITDSELLVRGRPTPGQHSGQDYELRLVLDEEVLTRLVRAGVSLTRALAG